MDLVNFSIEEFLGIVLFYPFLVYFIYICYDGIGIFRDIFERAGRTRKKGGRGG